MIPEVMSTTFISSVAGVLAAEKIKVYVNKKELEKRKLREEAIKSNNYRAWDNRDKEDYPRFSGEAFDTVKKFAKARKNIFITGKVQSGKTTLTKQLVEALNATERIAIIEDKTSTELSLKNPYGMTTAFFANKFTCSVNQILDTLVNDNEKIDRVVMDEILCGVDEIREIPLGKKNFIANMHGKSVEGILEEVEGSKFIDEIDIMVYVDHMGDKKVISDIAIINDGAVAKYLFKGGNPMPKDSQDTEE